MSDGDASDAELIAALGEAMLRGEPVPDGVAEAFREWMRVNRHTYFGSKFAALDGLER